MTLSVPGCARLWKSAAEKRPEPWEARWHCRGCPIGAGHAGVAVPEVQAQAASDSLRRMCAGCPAVGERMIQDLYCVSCYNRRRECARGRNAKGGKPRLMGKLHAETLCLSGTVTTTPAVASRCEAAILAAKAAAGAPLFIGRPPLNLASLSA